MDPAEDMMGEDIDIEEHDVLDNPRIKDMFLDITQIKTEVFYVDDDINEPMIEFEDESPIEAYEGADDITDDLTTEIAGYNGSTDSQPQFCSKIILGSKPNKPKIDPDTLRKEALNSKTCVYLEDWALRLQNSPCFCGKCSILFPTINALDSHNMSAHSFLVELDNFSPKNMARKSTVDHPMKKCHHCSQLFSDDNALIKHLYELLPLRENEVRPEVLNVQANKVSQELNLQGYQCPTCSCCYTDIREITTHLKLNHGIDKKAEVTMIKFHCPFCGADLNSLKDYNQHIAKLHRPTFCKKVEKIDRKRPFCLDSTKIKAESDMDASTRNLNSNLYKRCSLFLIRNSPVPKSVLFVCYKCSVHFVSAYFALKHSHQCRNAKCDQCKSCDKKVRYFDRYIHQLQHQVSPSFKVYKIGIELYKKILCKCPHCEVCFEDNDFWMHFPKCGSVEAVYCQKCDLQVSDPNHFGKHEKFKKFIIVQYVSMTDEKIVLIPTNKSIEMSERMKNGRVPPKGRSFVAQALKTGTDIKKLKYTSVNIKTEGSITCLAQKYDEKRDGGITLYYCTICECCFSLRRNWKHTSREGGCKNMVRRACHHCGLYFPKLSLHLQLHKSRTLTLHDFKFVTTRTDGAKVPTVPKIPDYYRCRQCDVAFITDKERKAHECKVELRKAKACVCGKKYSLKAHHLHSQFHIYHANLSEHKIMPKLLQQYELMANMWNILFFCKQCDIYYNSYDNAVEHSQKHITGMEDFEKSVPCKLCNLQFGLESYEKHNMLHKGNAKVKKGSFKILTFEYRNLLRKEWFDIFKEISREQQEYILSKSIYRRVRNIKMRCFKNKHCTQDVTTEYRCAKCNQSVNESDIYAHTHESFCEPVMNAKEHDSGSRVVLFNKQSDEKFNNILKHKSRQYNLYKCIKCSLCILYKVNTKRHHCTFGERKRKFCEICGQFFPIANHVALHDKFPNMQKDNINIVMYGAAKNKNSKFHTKHGVRPKINTAIRKYAVKKKKHVVQIYRCKCGLHFISKVALAKHVSECGNTEISSEKCSKCSLLFPTDILVSHLCMHHTKQVRFVVETVTETKVYKCPNCNLIFTNKKVLADHVCSSKDGVKCKKCNLVFHKRSAHKCDTVNVIQDNRVYMCKKCDLNFNHFRSWRNHECRRKSKINATPCNICGLRFSNRSTAMPVHKSRYHSRDEFRFVLVDPANSKETIISGNSNDCNDNTASNDSGDIYIVPDEI